MLLAKTLVFEPRGLLAEAAETGTGLLPTEAGALLDN